MADAKGIINDVCTGPCSQCAAFFSKNAYVDENSYCRIGRTRDTAAILDSSSQYHVYAPAKRRRRQKYLRRIYSRCLRKYLTKESDTLDVGSGDGYFPMFLKSKGIKATGIEPYSGPSQIPRDECVINSSFEGFNPGKKYDLITVMHAFEHFSDPDKAIEKCASLLKKNGKLFIAVPNYDSWLFAVCGEDCFWLNLKQHYYHYNARGLSFILRRHGFKVLWAKTHSSQCEPLLNRILARAHAFDSGPLSIWPIRPIAFRLSDFIGIHFDWIVDLFSKGGELFVMAELSNG